MSTLSFTKLEGIGNDFVLIDAWSLPEMDWPALTVRMCDRHFGIGSDGLLLLMPSEKADIRMRMFNPDGTEDMCGNGLRCMAVYARNAGRVGGDEFTIETFDGVRRAEVSGSSARVSMIKPSFKSADIPANLDVDEVIDYPIEAGGRVYRITAVQVGTPHAVIFASAESFWEVIPPESLLIQQHPVFPERVNVTWCDVESPESLRIRTWERGAGPTLGCGTGACAALVAANINGLASSRAEVTSPGGTLEIEWPDRGDILMSGPANEVYRGVWPLRPTPDT